MQGYRKWSVCLLTILLAFVLALLGKLTSDFATVASVACGAFAAANALGNHRSKSKETRNDDGWIPEVRARPPDDPAV